MAINPNTVLKAYRELEREGLVIAAAVALLGALLGIAAWWAARRIN